MAAAGGELELEEGVGLEAAVAEAAGQEVYQNACIS